MRLIAIMYLLGLAAIAVIFMYPGHELVGAKIWLRAQYNMYFTGGGDLQNAISQIVAMLGLATATLFAAVRALDL